MRNPLLDGGIDDRRAWEKPDCLRAAPLKDGPCSVSRALPPSLRDMAAGAMTGVESLRCAEALLAAALG